MGYENRFYGALEKIFVGAPIEGEGGYVNLLKIKEKYYGNVLSKFKQEVNSDPIIDTTLKRIFELLFNFLKNILVNVALFILLKQRTIKKYMKRYIQIQKMLHCFGKQTRFIMLKATFFSNLFMSLLMMNKMTYRLFSILMLVI